MTGEDRAFSITLLKELKGKFESLVKISKKEVAAVGDAAEDMNDGVWYEGTEEISYITCQWNYQDHGFNQNYINHPNFSYRSTNVENPVYPKKPYGNFSNGFQGMGEGNNGYKLIPTKISV